MDFIIDRDFRAAINVFKELKETKLKEVKGSMLRVTHQLEKINK